MTIRLPTPFGVLGATAYVIKRDHGRRCGPFRITVDEVKQTGYGFQFPFGPYVVGASAHLTRAPR